MIAEEHHNSVVHGALPHQFPQILRHIVVHAARLRNITVTVRVCPEETKVRLVEESPGELQSIVVNVLCRRFVTQAMDQTICNSVIQLRFGGREIWPQVIIRRRILEALLQVVERVDLHSILCVGGHIAPLLVQLPDEVALVQATNLEGGARVHGIGQIVAGGHSHDVRECVVVHLRIKRVH